MTNEQIAREVMGWRYEKKYNNGAICAGRDTWSSADKEITLHDFLNDHNAAMMVVEKMREDGYLLRVLGLSPCHYECLFSSYDSETGQWYSHEEATSDSLCHAIAEAALKAKGG